MGMTTTDPEGHRVGVLLFPLVSLLPFTPLCGSELGTRESQ
jgi:hypothetical protein